MITTTIRSSIRVKPLREEDWSEHPLALGLVVFIDRQLAGAFGNGARLYRQGPFLPGKPEHGYQLSLSPREFFRAGVEETNAWDDIKFGTTSIEHWYGIPDAAIPDGRQHFPSDYNYLNETDRFRWAGRLWREADPKLLDSVLSSMVRANVAWVPTMDIYEASRDLQRRSPGSATICIPRSRITSSPIPRITDRISSAGAAPTKRIGKRTTASGWPRSATSNARAAPSAAATTPASSTRCTASA